MQTDLRLDASSDAFWHGQQTIALEFGGPVVGRTVLDLACGSGALVRAAVGLGASLGVGMEMPGRIFRKYADCEFVAGDLTLHETWPGGTYDVVYCIESLYYLKDPVAALWEMWKKVKTGGRLVATVGNASSLLVEKARVDYGGDYRGMHAGTLDALGKNLPGCSKFDVFGVWIDPEQRVTPFFVEEIGASSVPPHRLVFVAVR